MSTYDLAGMLGDISGRANQVQLVACTVWYTNGAWRVYRGGLEIPVVWLEGATPRAGSCLVALDNPPSGQTTAYVLGMTYAKPWKWQNVGTVKVAGSGGWSTVTLYDTGDEVRCRYFGHYVPVVGHTVVLYWVGQDAYVIGTAPSGHSFGELSLPPFPPPMPDIQHPVTLGVDDFPPNMFRNWDSSMGIWSMANTRDARITSGQDAVWTYNNATASLVDKGIIDAVTFTLGPRSQSDDYPVTLQFYRSDLPFIRDEIGPATLDGPYEVEIPAKYPGGAVSLPVELGYALKQGGSITVKSTATAVFIDAPSAGYLRIKWRNNDGSDA